MPKFTSAEQVVDHWASDKSNLIALAHEFEDGTIITRDHAPCHRSFNRTDFSYEGQKRENLRGAYVKLSYGTPGGYNYSGSGTESHQKEYDPKVEAFYDYVVSDDSPWRGVQKTLLKDKNGKHRAIHVPNIHKQEMQYWLQMCFSTRSGAQRMNCIRLWYDLSFKHGFHPTEALYIISGIMYHDDQKTLQLNPLRYDWIFKGYDEYQSSFYNMWNAKPMIYTPGTLDKIQKGEAKHYEWLKMGAGSSPELYGMPNDIWIETDKDRKEATDFRSKLVKPEEYCGAFPSYFKSTIGKTSFSSGMPATDVAIGILKDMAKLWPR